MWILIFWLSTPFSGSSNVARQATLAVHSQEFGSERACKDALTAMKKVNVGELTLRGVCVSKD
ncbi:hypothetical protein AB9E53_07900 [Escherichia coli]|uniref:hypothetical protein n=1 Tax=Escherichia coli TaxID=562 RepID=UPI000BE3220E|nr:hypothetical protein [Escherichia coli]EKR5600619.1 hypothetical protein [Escherichia coli]MED8972108.1 hypothetical protein [Escherichia coli]MXE36249.1 hypothetical protein [Escherichia coli]CAH5764597.1 hypothetical protein AI2994V1_4639 [Escherichia coli]HAV8121892.1 hypothetical protein [Escherichia coli]